ncbi:hypothetical protein NZK32_06510 [Cyanobium sp. FGCU-52]|nr:hypothetical protein [Cyanobium sp. FGCU52]
MARFQVCRPLVRLGAALLLAGSGGPLWAAPASIPLQCRRENGPWRACTMLVEEVGQHWWLVIEGERFEFVHDGTGRMRLRREGGDWRDVESRWAADTSLCWNGICAKGPIPLD